MTNWIDIKQTPPPDNELIEIKGFDWSEFTAIGMFIPYKCPRAKGKSRFCLQLTNGEFFPEIEMGKDATHWRLIKGDES